MDPLTTAIAPTETSAAADAKVYGEGFAAIYASDRYAVFSRRLAKLALSLIQRHEAPGPELLDLACGAGAGSTVFATAGYTVSGIDRSEVMIDRAAARAQATGIELRLQQGEMQTFTLPYQVDIVTCLFDALNYLLEEEDLAQTFGRVAAALRAGGLLVFDMNTEKGLATRWGTGNQVSTMRPDLVELNHYRFQAQRSVNTVTTTVFVQEGDDGLYRRYSEIHRERGYPLKTVTDLLARAGFELLAVYGLSEQFQGLAGGLQPSSDDVGRMVVVARRIGAEEE